MRLLNATRSGVAQPLASYRGLGVSFRSETDETSHASWVELGGRRRHHVRIALNGSHADARAAIVGAIDNLEGLQRSYREQIARDEAEERRLRPLIGTPFPYQDDLDHKTASLREVNDELEAEGRAAAATASAAFAKAGGAGASASAPPDGDEDEDDGEAEEFEGDLEAAVDGCDDADAGSAAYAGERMAA